MCFLSPQRCNSTPFKPGFETGSPPQEDRVGWGWQNTDRKFAKTPGTRTGGELSGSRSLGLTRTPFKELTATQGKGSEGKNPEKYGP